MRLNRVVGDAAIDRPDSENASLDGVIPRASSAKSSRTEKLRRGRSKLFSFVRIYDNSSEN